MKYVGLLAGVGAAAYLATRPPSWLGLGLALAAPAFALCLLGGVLAEQLLVRPPRPATRVATLEVRRPRRYLPRWATLWVATLAATLSILLVGAGLAAEHSGRGLVLTCSWGVVTAGPWPGAFYGVPIGLTVLAGLIAAGGVAWAVARRPRDNAEPPGLDEARRRAAGDTIVAACGVLVAAPLTGCALTAGGIMRSIGCAPEFLAPLGWLTVATAVLAGLSGCAFLARLLFPRERTA
jgi:hypothetical protein